MRRGNDGHLNDMRHFHGTAPALLLVMFSIEANPR